MTLALEVIDASKAFGASQALVGAHFALARGTIHGLVGENGAGKSTLIKAITGVHTLDRGQILLDGKPCHFQTVSAAIAAGIGAVHQERNLVPVFSVAENIFLHQQPTKKGLVSYKTMFRQAQPWLDKVGLPVDPRWPAGRLSAAQSQLLEIARTLSLNSGVLLLDEPTASISTKEADRLFTILDELRASGQAILFVSHRLEEVLGLCDEVTVLRDGQSVLDRAAKSTLNRQTLITAMVGRQIKAAQNRETSINATLPPALSLRGVATKTGHREIDLVARHGEIVGVYGLVGSGRSELFRCLVGEGRVTGGQFLVSGAPVTIRNPHQALHHHSIGYVSEDRKQLGLILPLSVSHNVAITLWRRLSNRVGFASDRQEWATVKEVVHALDVKMRHPAQPVGQLSGGNQQKISLAKWIATEVDVFIVDEPTIGVDVRTKEEIY
ncbi:MAG: sugar ABC transporter ATP-binding protein, partial [Micrococcales bacterium]|nr:sugar ABC transporter ATP-binding protein [Micrococcales bacterium]